LSTQVRLGKVRLGKVNIDKEEKPIRKKYGEYSNVLFTEEQYEKLLLEFPRDYKERIERLSEYMASTGKPYKDHLATIRNWSKKESPQQTSQRRGIVI
jgi:FMN phosphatase YigB (HAD superfamily)